MKRASLLLVLVVGCGNAADRGAPDPLACTVDTDCAPGPLVSPDDPCCDTGVPLSVLSRAYLDHRASYLASSCAGHTCPTLPPPMPPLACALVPRCSAGRCAGSCP